MSGCHDPEYGCRCFINQVNFDKEIKGIDLKIEAISEVVNEHEKEIEELEEKISEKYAHPNVISRLERLEKYMSLIDHLNNNRHEWKKGCQELSSEISQLCHKINDLYQIKEKMGFKKPHKCPVCDGEGNDKHSLLLSNPHKFNNCKTCDGKGIVWG